MTQLRVTGVVEANAEMIRLGIEREEQFTRARINQQPVTHMTELTRLLPLIPFHSLSSQLLIAEPSLRRAFLDWGLFYSNPDFFEHWKNFQHILKQRNAALKQQKPDREIILWDLPLAEVGERINEMRNCYFEAFKKEFSRLVLENDLFEQGITFKFMSGWKQDESLHQSLSRNLIRDRAIGFTRAGPQRADFILVQNGQPVSIHASRGQIKLLAFICRYVQALLQDKLNTQRCIFLLDDLTAELDASNTQKILSLLSEINSQVFLTNIQRHSEFENVPASVKMFHVKQGQVETL
jgi:DNA replication and repair protein RecF